MDRHPPPFEARGTALFLDLDGTVAEIAARPGDVGPDPERNSVLRALVEFMGGRVVVLTGRALDEADRILDGAVVQVAAVHGLVRRISRDTVVSVRPSPRLSQAKAVLHALAESQEGLLLEDKGSSVALHYRQAPETGPVVRDVAQRLAKVTGLVLQNGAMVSELRTAGPNKGDSLKTFMASPLFAGTLPVAIGDDLTDEDAFAAAEEMGGYGILVGPHRSTHARYTLASVADVLAWLGRGLRP